MRSNVCEPTFLNLNSEPGILNDSYITKEDPTRNFRVLVAIGATALLLNVHGTIARADDFYAGKTIHVTVGFSAGGGYDTYARAVARHIGKHIPGNPSLVVDNMDGAGSLIAAN